MRFAFPRPICRPAVTRTTPEQGRAGRWGVRARMAVMAGAAVVALAPVGAAGTGVEEAEPLDFNLHVRPILMQNCAGCHGGVMKSAGVSFIYREEVLGAGDSGHPVAVPGDAAGSEMIRRVTATDPIDRMPPPDHGPALSDEEVAVLKRWIDEGAQWGEHWAFQPPVSAGLPEVDRADWPVRELDVFLLAAMEREGLEPSPRSQPEPLLRRVALDLTGLPPSPEQLARFVGDPSQQTYEAIIDELLESPAYGERWAAMWLDLARYSDTYGFEKDPHRDIWPFRDYVVRSFNDDKPYDRFTIEQLAGDLLPEAGAEELLASAFHRNTQTNTEGGTDDEEFRVAAVIDRVNTTWTVWQATTIGCVQCHSHPYDPIEHEEYFKLLDIFNQTEDCDLDDDFPRFALPGDGGKADEAARLDREIRELRLALNRPALDLAAASEWNIWRPGGIETSSPQGDLEWRDEADEFVLTGTHPPATTHTLTGPPPPGGTRALRIDILPVDDNPAAWPEDGSVLSQVKLHRIDADGGRHELAIREVFADAIDGPHDPMDVLGDGPPGLGDYPKLNRPRWGVLVLEEPTQPAADGDVFEIVLHQRARVTGSRAVLLRRFTLSATADERWHELAVCEDRAAVRGAWAGKRERRGQLGGTQVPVMVERAPEARRETRVFIRGNWLEKGDLVEAGTPALFPPVNGEIAVVADRHGHGERDGNGNGNGDAAGNGRPMDRLDLARWLVQPDQPLTARVAVNRFWQQVFGVGIVETVEDFGSSGTRPWHPELLDHLALQFQGEMEWSVKHLLRELVTSAAYQQDNRVSAELWQRDPSNRWLARGPRLRLTAEMVRDQTLAVSGLLSDKRYGPPVMPYQPDGIWNNVYSGAQWQLSEGEDRYRRALYTYWRRTSPYPAFLTFDAPARDICSARRLPTNTPLQALVTLNDENFVRAAQALAGRMQEEGGDELESRLRFGLETALARPADARDVASLAALHAEVTTEYRQAGNEELYRGLADSPEAAALVVTANAILNLDAFLTR